MSAFQRAAPLDNDARAGILSALLAATSMAATGFVANELVDDGTPGVVVGFYELLFALAFVGTINILPRRRATGPRLTWWVLLTGVAYACAIGAFYTALSRIDYSVGAPILGATPLVAYAAARFLLPGHERITRRALTGAVLIVSGVGLIGVAN